MNQINLTPIINALILLIGAIISAFVIPWIREKTNREQRDTLNAWVQIAVGAAEQLYAIADGAKKREYVLNFLMEHGYVIDDTVINALENEVLKLHHELYEYDTEKPPNETEVDE